VRSCDWVFYRCSVQRCSEPRSRGGGSATSNPGPSPPIRSLRHHSLPNFVLPCANAIDCLVLEICSSNAWVGHFTGLLDSLSCLLLAVRRTIAYHSLLPRLLRPACDRRIHSARGTARKLRPIADQKGPWWVLVLAVLMNNLGTTRTLNAFAHGSRKDELVVACPTTQEISLSDSLRNVSREFSKWESPYLSVNYSKIHSFVRT
jgi:hypothetical protein